MHWSLVRNDFVLSRIETGLARMHSKGYHVTRGALRRVESFDHIGRPDGRMEVRLYGGGGAVRPWGKAALVTSSPLPPPRAMQWMQTPFRGRAPRRRAHPPSRLLSIHPDVPTSRDSLRLPCDILDGLTAWVGIPTQGSRTRVKPGSPEIVLHRNVWKGVAIDPTCINGRGYSPVGANTWRLERT